MGCLTSARQPAFYNYLQAYTSKPIAPAIRATGRISNKPPAKIRHSINNGSASISRITAAIFVTPQPIFTARVIAFTKRTSARIAKIISNIKTTPYVYFIIHFVFCPRGQGLAGFSFSTASFDYILNQNRITVNNNNCKFGVYSLQLLQNRNLLFLFLYVNIFVRSD